MKKKYVYDKCEVYPLAIELVALIDETVTLMPRGRGDVAEDLQNLVKSLPVDIALAFTEASKERQKKLYQRAVYSIVETTALLDICHRLEMIDQEHLKANHSCIQKIESMLGKML